jgi:hypothetical protein
MRRPGHYKPGGFPVPFGTILLSITFLSFRKTQGSMLISDVLQLIAVVLEAAVTVIAISIATRKQKSYGWYIAITFGLFVLFDIFRIFSLPLPDTAHSLILLVACGSMVYAVWLMYRET